MTKGSRQFADCPHCGKTLGLGHPMQAHLKDAHGVTGREAHMIANPNDGQAKRQRRWSGRRRVAPLTRPAKQPEPDFDLLDDGDDFL